MTDTITVQKATLSEQLRTRIAAVAGMVSDADRKAMVELNKEASRRAMLLAYAPSRLAS